MKRISTVIEKLRASLEAEDYILTAVVFIFLPLLKGGPLAFALSSDPAPGPLRLVIFLLIFLGLWICLGTRPVEDGWALEDRLPFKKNLLLHLAYLGQVTGIPFMILILSDGDTGIIFVWWGFFAFISLIAWHFSLRKKARPLRVRHRRYIIILFTVASTWYCTEYLIDRIIIEQGHLSVIIANLKAFSITGLLGNLLEFLILSLLFIFPYTVMVIMPRVAAGEFEKPRVWLKRFVFFILSVLGALVVKIGQLML